MPKKIDRFLNIVMGSFIGVFLGYGGYEYVYYRTHPDLYAWDSAPWYTSIMVYGAVAVAAVVICLLGKLIIRKRMQ